MIEITLDKNIIYTNATGTLEERDYDKLLPMVTDLIARHGKVRWLFQMEEFHGWSLEAFWRDVKFDLKHADNFEKIAMVGEKKWQKWMTDLMKPFTKAEIRFFVSEQKEQAKDWIKID